MFEKERAYRQAMIEFIENKVGIWEAVWNEWPTEQIETLCRHLGGKWSDD